MAIVNLSGVSWSSISKVNGITKSSISNIGGAPVSSGPTCTTVTYRYNGDASTSCISSEASYEFDSTNNILYVSGQCGGTQASNGYYSDGVSVYSWFNGTWSYYASCSPGPSCTTISFGFDRFDPNAACTAPFGDFEYDTDNNILYNFEGCGTEVAKDGFVSDGRRIYRVAEGALVPYGPCGR
jgi:hypothetical protein